MESIETVRKILLDKVYDSDSPRESYVQKN